MSHPAPACGLEVSPPYASPRVHATLQRLVVPVRKLFGSDVAGGILLLLAAALALVVANSPWHEQYARLWETPLGWRLGEWSFERDLHFWVNDGLMTIFFFVVGLEIRRERYDGVLADARRVAAPLAAALGGMVVPALMFVALNHGRSAAAGWGIPIATDIAFAVGVVSLLGSRVPAAARTVLLTLAVLDDVGAIVVIAVFYSAGATGGGLALAAVALTAVVGLQRSGVRTPWVYAAPAIMAWVGVLQAGIHPTLAGVAVGLLTPVQPWVGEPTAPAIHLHRRLHGWVALGIMPLFAFANAGVPLGDTVFDSEGWRVFLGVALGLAVGKPIGVALATRLACRAGVATLPDGVDWTHFRVLSLSAGIGFTMSLFIATLALPHGPLLEVAKLAILAGSAAAGVATLAYGRLATSSPTQSAGETRISKGATVGAREVP